MALRMIIIENRLMINENPYVFTEGSLLILNPLKSLYIVNDSLNLFVRL